MNINEFKGRIKSVIQRGSVLDNPGKGTSTIKVVSDRGVSYVRGKSVIYISFQDIFDAFHSFVGRKVTSSDLKSYRPAVFDSKANGHSCNCTFLFVLLKGMGFTSEIGGQGIKGSPYFVVLPQDHGE